MSLINQVLKDIDQRQAGATLETPIDANVATVADSRGGSDVTRRLTILSLVTLVMAVVAIGLWWWRGVRDNTAIVANTVAASAAAVSAAPAAPTEVPPTPAAADATVIPPAAAPPPSPDAPISDGSRAALEGLAGVTSDWSKTMAPPEASGAPGAEAARAPNAKPPAAVVSKVASSAQVSDSLLKRAEQAFRGDRLSEGQQLLRQALSRNPQNHAARELLAQVLIDVGRVDEAERRLTEGTQIAPERKEFVLPLVGLKQRNGDEIGALALLEASIGRFDGDPEAHAYLAALLQRQARHAEATNNYVLALRKFPTTARWLVGLGVSLQAQGMRQAAIDSYENALATGTLEPALETFTEDRLIAAREGR